MESKMIGSFNFEPKFCKCEIPWDAANKHELDPPVELKPASTKHELVNHRNAETIFRRGYFKTWP